MRLKINHVSTYDYSAPMRFVVQSHRLFPSAFDGQKVIDWQVEVEGAQFGSKFRDAAGDTLRTMTLAGPVQRVEVQVSGIVETRDLNGVLCGHAEKIHPLSYLRDTEATQADSTLAELAGSAVKEGYKLDGLDLAHRLAGAIGEAITYRPGATGASTTAAEALKLGQGVCQDHAHALIAIARHHGMPARYVSGYLHATSDGVAHEAGHAWAELFVTGLGWVGFDPANKCCPDERYVRIGSGLDAAEAAPIRGISRGDGAERLAVSVGVAQ